MSIGPSTSGKRPFCEHREDAEARLVTICHQRGSQPELNLSRYLAETFKEPEGHEFAPMVYCQIMDVGVPFVVRRARLLMGMTQAEFAELFEVDDGTVSRWERGKLHPAPKVWKRIRDITLKEDSMRDAALAKSIACL